MPFDAVLHASGEYLQHISYRSDPNNPDTDGDGIADDVYHHDGSAQQPVIWTHIRIKWKLVVHDIARGIRFETFRNRCNALGKSSDYLAGDLCDAV